MQHSETGRCEQGADEGGERGGGLKRMKSRYSKVLKHYLMTGRRIRRAHPVRDE